MSRSGLPALDHEPKNLGGKSAPLQMIGMGTQVPPPSYRSTVIMDTDTWSQYSTSSGGMMKRRNSWTNLVESDENLTKHKVNCYPKVTTPFKQPSLSSASSVASDFQATEVFRQYVVCSKSSPVKLDFQPRGSLPVLADPGQLNIRPAGSLPPISRGPSKAPSVAMSPMPGSTIPPKTPLAGKKRNRLQEWRRTCCKPMVGLCCLLIILALVVGAIIAIVLSHVLPPPDKLTMQWYPPSSVSGGQNQSSTIQMSAQGDQVKFQLQGALPFKGNYISYYDFKTNKVVIIDESLKSNGRNLACFVMNLDTSNLKDATAMRKAAANSKTHNHMTTGWQESWMWMPSPMTAPPTFNPPIKECDGARWIQLDNSGQDQKSRKCSDCYDFCLPDYGIATETGNNLLNIIRRDCFYLFVPEWRSYAQANSIEQNQRDFETYYRNRVHLSPTYGGSNGESKWIPLSVPRGMQNVMNQTGQAIGAIGGAIGGAVQNVAQGVTNTVFGNQGQPGVYGSMVQNPNMQQGVQGQGQSQNQAYPSMQQQQGPDTGVTGVVNLHGVNGNTGTNLYQMGSATNPQGQIPGQTYPAPYGSQGYSSQNGQGQPTNGQNGGYTPSTGGGMVSGPSQQYPPNPYGSMTNAYGSSNGGGSSQPQMTGVNSPPVAQGYPGQISNLNGQHQGPQSTNVPTSNTNLYLGRSTHMGQELNSQNTGGYQNPTTYAGGAGYSSDVVRPPNTQAANDILASLQAQAIQAQQYRPDAEQGGYAGRQGISGMATQQQTGANGYSPDINIQNTQPTGQWIRN